MAKVLITRNITSAHLKLLMDAELEYEVSTAVKFDISFESHQVIGAMKTGNDWIFTSVNAVKAIHLILAKYQKKFEQKIYCVGTPAYALLTQLGYFSVEKFDSEASLAQAIDWTQNKSYTHYCSNNFRSIIPGNNKKAKSSINFVEVYSTKLSNPIINDVDFDYIFFFSPLAVKSILRKNPKLKSAHAICIGPATERVVKDLGVKKYSRSEQPSLKSMVHLICNI